MDKNRKTAYLTLFEMERSQAYSNIELNRKIGEGKPDSPAFVRELVYGVLENRIYLDYILEQLIPKGLKGVKKKPLTLLRMGLYQIMYMNGVPKYAAVNETVRLARKVIPGREGFINGVLRGYDKKASEVKLPDRSQDPVKYLSLRYSYAEWIVRLWIDQYGEDKTEELLAAGNQKPAVSIRVNLLKTTVEALIQDLEAEGFSVKKGKYSSRILYVKGSGLLDTKSYSQGFFSVQDESSVLAVETLAPESGERIFDICAAPGGKTLAMAEWMDNKGQITAFDVYSHKLKLIDQQAKRLGINIVQTEERDGLYLDPERIEKADRVLVDAPCSGLGVIRRKPEIKYKEIDDGGKALCEKQFQILSQAGHYVKKGGFLLYSTCTVNKIENTDVISRFLRSNSDFELVRSRQLLPDVEGTDGFYICKMRKKGIPKGEKNGGRLQDR